MKTGGRFSKNALRASAASCVENARRMLASSKRTWSSRSMRVARVMPRFVRRLATG
jgi:hypothetical protein